MRSKRNSDREAKKDSREPKVGEGFSDSRGYIPENGPIPKHNGLNVNNEPEGMQEREKAKEKRR